MIVVNSKQRQAIYLLLAVVGLIGCWYFNFQWFGAPGSHSAKAFSEAMFANSASSSVGWDITFGGVAAAIFIVVEGSRIKMRMPWLYVVLFFVVAMAFALPLFLAMRERQLDRNTASAASA